MQVMGVMGGGHEEGTWGGDTEDIGISGHFAEEGPGHRLLRNKAVQGRMGASWDHSPEARGLSAPWVLTSWALEGLLSPAESSALLSDPCQVFSAAYTAPYRSPGLTPAPLLSTLTCKQTSSLLEGCSDSSSCCVENT